MFIEKFNSKIKQERVVFYLTSSMESGLTCVMPDECASHVNRGSYLYLQMVTRGLCCPEVGHIPGRPQGGEF